MESLSTNIPSSFVKRKHKLVIDKGNGEAKLYIGSVKDEETYNKFFSQWHPYNKFFLDRDNLLDYLESVEGEFSRTSRYNEVSSSNFDYLINKVQNWKGNFNIDLSIYCDKKRVYIRSKSKAWTLIREITIPLITELKIQKIDEEIPANYYIYLAKSETIKTRGHTKKTNNARTELYNKKNNRNIEQRIKDLVWARDAGMCQANWKIDSSFDKNTGEICGNNEFLEFDHIHPISKGGLSTYRNLQLLCQYHNRIKSNKEL